MQMYVYVCFVFYIQKILSFVVFGFIACHTFHDYLHTTYESYFTTFRRTFVETHDGEHHYACHEVQTCHMNLCLCSNAKWVHHATGSEELSVIECIWPIPLQFLYFCKNVIMVLFTYETHVHMVLHPFDPSDGSS